MNMREDWLYMDADRLTDALTRAGNASSRARRNGECTHSWAHCPPDGPAKCLHCDKVFATEAELWAEGAEVLARYR